VQLVFHHIHPALSGAPSAFLALLLFLHGAQFFLPSSPSWLRPAQYLLSSAALGVLLAAFLSGYIAQEYAGGGSLIVGIPQLSEEKIRLIADHHSMGRLSLMTLSVTLMLLWLSDTSKKAPLFALYILFILLSFFLTSFTAFKGGNLVFSHHIKPL
jgi:uncharacterized membrane protein